MHNKCQPGTIPFTRFRFARLMLLNTIDETKTQDECVSCTSIYIELSWKYQKSRDMSIFKFKPQGTSVVLSFFLWKYNLFTPNAIKLPDKWQQLHMCNNSSNNRAVFFYQSSIVTGMNILFACPFLLYSKSSVFSVNFLKLFHLNVFPPNVIRKNLVCEEFIFCRRVRLERKWSSLNSHLKFKFGL